MFLSFLFYILSFSLFNGSFYLDLDVNDRGDVVKFWESSDFKESLDVFSENNISARSFSVYDLDSGFLVYDFNGDQVLPIASISKIMSALIFFDLDIEMNDYYELKSTDKRFGGRDHVFWGDKLRNIDLLSLSIVASDNTATSALISSGGLSEGEFVEKMNDKALEMNLKDTFFEDATGLSHRNISTSKELLQVFLKLVENEELLEIARIEEYEFETSTGRAVKAQSTNRLLNYFNQNELDFKIIAGKTGFNNAALYCFVLVFEIDGRRFISVVLGSDDINSRFSDSRKIVDKIKSIYNN